MGSGGDKDLKVIRRLVGMGSFTALGRTGTIVFTINPAYTSLVEVEGHIGAGVLVGAAVGGKAIAPTALPSSSCDRC